MRLVARDAAGETVDQLQLAFTLKQDFDTALAGFAFREALPITELDRWQWNAPGGTDMTFEIIGEDTWRCDIAFGDTDRWAYPMLRLPEDSEVGRTEAVLLEARVEAPADVRIMMTMRNGTTFYTSDPIINDN